MRGSMDEYNRALGSKLRKAVKLRGVSLRSLSRATAIPERTLQDVLCGRHAATAANVAKLCAALDVDANAILGVRRSR